MTCTSTWQLLYAMHVYILFTVSGDEGVHVHSVHIDTPCTITHTHTPPLTHSLTHSLAIWPLQICQELYASDPLCWHYCGSYAAVFVLKIFVLKNTSTI